MSDWDLSLCHCLPLSWENAAKVLRFVLGEKKGSLLPWRTKTHISSVLLFFSPAAAKLPVKRIKRMKTWPVMAPHHSCCSYCCTACVNMPNMCVHVCMCFCMGRGKTDGFATECTLMWWMYDRKYFWACVRNWLLKSDVHICEMFVMFPTEVKDVIFKLVKNPYRLCRNKNSFYMKTLKPLQ